MHKYAWDLHISAYAWHVPRRARRKVLPTVASEEAAGGPGDGGDGCSSLLCRRLEACLCVWVFLTCALWTSVCINAAS